MLSTCFTGLFRDDVQLGSLAALGASVFMVLRPLWFFGRKLSLEEALSVFLEARGLTNIPSDGRTRKDFVDCQTMSPNVLGYKHWIVDLEFDADGHLIDAGVAILNIFL